MRRSTWSMGRTPCGHEQPQGRSGRDSGHVGIGSGGDHDAYATLRSTETAVVILEPRAREAP
jgi:hypothetical protein